MAGRTPRPWFRSSKNAWYVHLNGNTIRLGRDKGEAYRTFHRLMAGVESHAPTPQVEAGVGVVTFGELVARYLDDLGRRVTPRTLSVAACYLSPVVSACGPLEVCRHNRHRFEAAVLHRPTWGPTTANHVLSRVAAAFNWAAVEGLIPSNPMKGVRKPSARSRGTDALMSEENYRRLYDAAPPYLKGVLLTLRDTGSLTLPFSGSHQATGCWSASHSASVIASPSTLHPSGVPGCTGPSVPRHRVGTVGDEIRSVGAAGVGCSGWLAATPYPRRTSPYP